MHEVAIDTGTRFGKFNVVDAVRAVDATIDLDRVIRDKIANKKRFFGIEVSPVPSAEELDFNKFDARPLFTSITWLLDHNLQHAMLGDAPALKLAAVIRRSSSVLSHLTCYKMTENQLREILEQHHVENVLALRGGMFIVQTIHSFQTMPLTSPHSTFKFFIKLNRLNFFFVPVSHKTRRSSYGGTTVEACNRLGACNTCN